MGEPYVQLSCTTILAIRHQFLFLHNIPPKSNSKNMHCQCLTALYPYTSLIAVVDIQLQNHPKKKLLSIGSLIEPDRFCETLWRSPLPRCFALAAVADPVSLSPKLQPISTQWAHVYVFHRYCTWYDSNGQIIRVVSSECAYLPISITLKRDLQI